MELPSWSFQKLAIVTGKTKKSPIANASEMKTAKPHVRFEISSSGSSSCAVVAVCHRAGLTERAVIVSMPGGELAVEIQDDGEIRMRGPAEEIAAGRFSPDLLAAVR